MNFDQPKKFCPDCGKGIPANGFETEEHGNVICDGEGRPVSGFRRIGLLACENCAINKPMTTNRAGVMRLTNTRKESIG